VPDVEKLLKFDAVGVSFVIPFCHLYDRMKIVLTFTPVKQAFLKYDEIRQ